VLSSMEATVCLTSKFEATQNFDFPTREYYYLSINNLLTN